ncbi:Tn3 family transposase post-transcriptional regulator TnpC [Herbaspirillum huttiense]|uniref:Tn3 family transposase post-transcriptional regulator TnpC n=1 Tax=Herbaspirillum huttiense TaxID=863372 RepID=UPI0039B0C600
MTKEHETIKTAYGLVDNSALKKLQQEFDTSALLTIVDELDQVIDLLRSEDGLRDELLRLHGMAHTVLNGAGLSVPTGEDSLPEMVFDTISCVQRIVGVMRGWQRSIEPLEALAPKD